MSKRFEIIMDLTMILGGLFYFIATSSYITDKLTTVYSLNLM